MFQSVDDVVSGLGRQEYICNKNVATVVYLGTMLQKPILVEGPAGVGKTELGKVLAGALGMELIRLQCYEGLDEGKALYEWEYAKQLLYTQILKDKIDLSRSGGMHRQARRHFLLRPFLAAAAAAALPHGGKAIRSAHRRGG